MDIAAISIQNRVVTLVFSAVLLIVGYLAYSKMSRLEDPEFTIKEALVITPYPGASPQEVEEEVTDLIETAIQEMGQLEQVRSESTRGLSTITVEIKDKYDKNTLPQVWDELRRKVSDVARDLPPGSGSSIVVDDYGEVYGVFMVVTGDGYSYAELKDYVDLLRRELLLVDDVGKITTYGERKEAIYIDFSQEQMAQLGIPISAILKELNQRNTVTDSGQIKLGQDYIEIVPTGNINSVESIERLLIKGAGGQQFLLRDVATVKRGYLEPQNPQIRFDGREGIGLGISTVSGGNVVVMGEGLNKKLAQLESERPVGIELGVVSLQSEAVKTAIEGFTVSLLQAIVIVVFVLLVFMGVRSGLIIGFVLLLTISGSFVFLNPMGVALERISLGALIIALGMLVDNAIVIIDGMLTRISQGMKPEKAASDIVKQSMWPLLGATFIAILAFASIGTSSDSTGEFCRSLFQVVFVSLLLSWVTAITITPLLGVMFLKNTSSNQPAEALYSGKIYQIYRSLLTQCLHNRALCIVVVLLIFGASIWGFSKVDQSFFPSSTRPQFMVDIWLPQGRHIDETLETVKQVEKIVKQDERVSHVTSVLGRGALRFLLTYSPGTNNPSYAQLLVSVESSEIIYDLMKDLNVSFKESLPNTYVEAYQFEVGPGGKGKIEARFQGSDPVVLRQLAQEAISILNEDPAARSIRTNWRSRTKIIQPVISQEQANLNGITQEQIASVFQQGFEGQRVGVFREGDLLLPLIAKTETRDSNLNNMENLQIWSPQANKMVPLRQFIDRYDLIFEDNIIIRQDRKRSISVYADPNEGYASELFNRVKPQIEAIKLPNGYELEWGGEYEDTRNAQAGLSSSIPMFVGLMMLITILLFNSIKIPIIIWLTVPLATIGVTLGLLVTNQSFGFMSLLGFLSLSGMLIKNAIVLIEEINAEWSTGKALDDAIILSGVNRLRPVAMAALTTALGMLPLTVDAFFSSMAVTIIGGLMVATLLTMCVVPVLYRVFYTDRIEGQGAGYNGHAKDQNQSLDHRSTLGINEG